MLGEEAYIRYGISIAGLSDAFTRFGPDIPADATTNTFCHEYIKPFTAPPGWEDTPVVVDKEKGWYAHIYRNIETGEVLRCGHDEDWPDAPPSGSRSYCEVLSTLPLCRRAYPNPRMLAGGLGRRCHRGLHRESKRLRLARLVVQRPRRSAGALRVC